MGHYRCFEPPSVLPGRAIHRSSRASRPRWAKVIDARNKICWHVKFATRRRRHAGLDDPILADRRDLSWDEGQWKRLRGALANVNEHAPTYQTEFRVHRPNGERRWCIVAVAASIDATHRVVRLGGVTVDITDRKSAEERQTLLVREVDHRARNALAVVQSIVRLTRAESKEAYIAAVEGRITALSRAHVLLSESRWQGANLSRLLNEELAPYRRNELERIVTNGPAVFLAPATAQILALTLHELATNAAKYGALSSTVGRVRLSWQVGPSRLELQRVETGGRSVQPPHSEGYGTRVINASVARQLDGCATFDWHPEGLRFTMSIPLGEKTIQPESASRGRWTTEEDEGAARRKVVAGNRLLLVEDARWASICKELQPPTTRSPAVSSMN